MARLVIKRKFDEQMHLEKKIYDFFGNLKDKNSNTFISTFAPALVDFIKFDRNKELTEDNFSKRRKITNNIQKLLESNKIVREQKNISMKIEDSEFLKNLVIRSKKLFKSNKDERFLYFEKEIIKHFDVLLAAEILSRINKNRKGVV